jgi:nucleoside-diphosphate-sugar epimerase
MNENKVLITGGAGYIGSRLVPTLMNNGYEVTVLDSLQYSEPSLLQYCNNKLFNFVRGDASDLETLLPLIDLADIVIPLAAVVGAPACKLNPTYATNINLDAIKLISKNLSSDKKLIYPTTNSGYGISKGGEMCTEESPLNPISLYGTTKADAEESVLKSGNGICFRLATVFGTSPRMRWDLLVNDFTLRAYQDKSLVLFEGDFKRNYIHIQDVCDTFLYGIENYKVLNNEVFNLGLSSANLSKRQLAEKIKSYVPKLAIIDSDIGTDPDKRDYIVSNEKLENTGWNPKVSIDEGIVELLKAAAFVPAKPGSNV